MNDPISDFLTRLRNASRARLDECVAPHSKLKESIAVILKGDGFITDFSVGADDRGHKTLIVKMKYVDGAPVLTDLQRVSKSGRRLYFKYTEIPRVLNGLGISILSTSQGLMKDQDARRNKVGGEVICKIW
ncbi:MAG: 30S ribosomal protein S8 [Opitutaceae bacterium]|jgi:small subunit ribosomal protein S8|nr:30S ribosomal protein S8 [Opitutaceae bacterium]|tara:strand:- start:856 stop:1248 length:393 start_codon:yes stop_codon:yes gene_type:complete